MCGFRIHAKWPRFLLPILVFVLLAKTSVIPVVFTNEEVQIDFGGQFQLRESPGATLYPHHLPEPLTTVDFCPWRPQPPEVQQVMRPERGFLCELHILPAATEAQALIAVKKAHAHESHKHARNSRPGAFPVGSHRVIRWRWQAGKSRLDHYLLIGKKFNYLFVSSPYGSNGSIEAILTRVQFREPAQN